jgi:hypothetical protein
LPRLGVRHIGVAPRSAVEIGQRGLLDHILKRNAVQRAQHMAVREPAQLMGVVALAAGGKGRDTARAMSQENVEIVRRLYPGTVDLVATLADPGRVEATRAVFEPLVHPDFETVAVAGQVPLSHAGAEFPEGSSRPTYYGLDGFVAAFLDWLSAWESWAVTATDFIDVDENRVLVLLDVRARSKTHQVEMPIDAANLLTLRDGRVARLELFFERAQALEAAGLSE